MLTLKIAFRNIFRQRRRSVLTGLSMCGGYMLFVFSISLLEGSYGNIIEIFTRDQTGHIQVHKEDYVDRPKIYKTIRDRETVEAAFRSHGEVTAWAPRVFSPALAYAGDKAYPAQVMGIDPHLEPGVTRIRDKVSSSGSYFTAQPDDDGYYSAMIGQGLAVSLGITTGDEIVLISQGADGSIANDIFMVSAIIGNRTSFDRNAVYLPLGAAQQFLSLGSDVHEYALLVEDIDRNRLVTRELQQALPALTVSPWQVVQSTFYRTMQSDKQGNHFMMGIVIFIVFIGVLNTVVMSVLERTREFGVLRAIGCRPGRLVSMVLLETLLLAGISIAIGLVLVFPIVVWLTQVGFQVPEPIDMGGITFQHMKGELSLFVFLMPMAFIFITAALISLLPGLRAARILPRDALGAIDMLMLRLAFRNLFRNTRRTLLTCILISSSLIALILVDGLILGTQEIMVGGATRTLEGEAQVFREGFPDNLEVDLYIADPAPILSYLESDGRIYGYAPRVIVGGMVASSYNTAGGLIYGVDHRQELKVSRIRDAVIKGRYLSGEDREILIGISMADLLEVEIGDRIILTAAAVDTNEIAQELFRVSGILEFGPDEMDESFVFINLHKAQQMLGMEGRLHQVALRFASPDDALDNDLPVYTELNRGDIVAKDWIELQPAFGAMIDMAGYSTLIVAVILFLLTSLGVINSMFMSIYERIYEFGVAKAIGTRPSQVTGLVLLEALLLALMSCIAGIILGYLLNYYFSIHGVPLGEFEVSGIAITGRVETRVALYQFINFPVYVTLLTMAAAIYPALFASRIVPTQALQRAL